MSWFYSSDSYLTKLDTVHREYNASEILYEITDDISNCSLDNGNDNISINLNLGSREAAPIEVDGKLFCPPTWDRISCWPFTPAGKISVIPCFAELNEVPYDTSQNSSRLCLLSGFWAEKSDYSKCKALVQETVGTLEDTTFTSDSPIVYYLGYGLSLVALSFALAIFFHFKDLRCIRNTIHSNLMLSYMFHAITWIAIATLQNSPLVNNKVTSNGICLLYILLTYFTVSSFFWMFIEGLYLYILVVRTFSIERVNVALFTLIGWGFPIILVILWAPTKYLYSYEEEDERIAEKGFNCPWQDLNIIDLIYICPIYFVLLVNLFFLGVVIYVLITKVQTTATALEFQQYRKGVKALLVLTPLLGMGYILLLVTPDSGSAKIVFNYLQATLNSTQGFTVAVLYCFLNAEVQNSLRYQMERWRNARTLKHGDYPLPMHHTFSSRSVRSRNGIKGYRLRYHSSFNNSITNSSSSRNSSGRANGSTLNGSSHHHHHHLHYQKCQQLIRSHSNYTPKKSNFFEEYL